jgi:transposase
MAVNKLLKKCLGVNDIVIESVELTKTHKQEDKLIVHGRPYAKDQCRCPRCSDGKKLPKYDTRREHSTWRGLDLGGLIVEVECDLPRVSCPIHGVVTAAAPWAFPGGRFTRDFDLTVAWMAKALNKSAVSEYLRISWETVGRCISRARNYLEPDGKSRLQNLKRIGIDETSYSKGRRYITTVVDHDTNTVVWVAKNHGEAVLSSFFEELTEEQRAAIEVVTGDGARWITACCEKYCPHACRCTDPFHVVSWATDALDDLRKDAWREANNDLKDLKKEIKRGRGRPAADDEKSKLLSDAKKRASDIKNSRYSLGKAPENLTEKQEVKLAQIKAKNTQLYRGYLLKESLRLLLKNEDVIEATYELENWLSWAQRCRIPQFVELGRKIKRHKQYILNFIETGISNARVEGNNNLISLLVHRSFGFRNFQNMVDLIMLVCSSIQIPLPNRAVPA